MIADIQQIAPTRAEPNRIEKAFAMTGQTDPVGMDHRERAEEQLAERAELDLLAMVGSNSELERFVRDLTTSELRYRRLFEAAHDGILLLEPDTRKITDANPFIVQLLGYSRDELVGKELWEIGLLRDERESQEAFRTLRETGSIRYDHLPLQSKGGDLHNVEFVSNLYYERARPVIQCNIRDITDRRRAEEQLAARARETVRSNQDLEQFAYAASHDLQEPLRAISGVTELLAQRYHGRLDEQADRYISLIVEGCGRMYQLIHGLLAYSRLGTRGQPLEPVDSATVLARALADLQAAIAEAGAEVAHDPMPTVTADRAQLGQLFQNLIANALKFRSAEPPRIHISAQRDHDLWTFAIADNGIGIDPQYAEQIFAIFQRLHTRDEYPGTGIGLAICKKIVERHGGRIWVESQSGQGSTFRFTLPLAPLGACP